jgi:hypothetical protein
VGTEGEWEEGGSRMVMPPPRQALIRAPARRSSAAPATPQAPPAEAARGLPSPETSRPTLRRVLRYSPHPALAGTLAATTAVAVAWWLTHRLWAAGPLPGDDAMAHLVRAEFGVEWLVPRGRGGRVADEAGGGYEQYLFLGPGLSWAVGVVRWLSLGWCRRDRVQGGGHRGDPGAAAGGGVLARSLRLGRRAAGLAAVVSLCVSSPFGGAGIPGTFDIGPVSHQFGAVPTELALGGMLRVAVDRRRRWMLARAAALAAVLVGHAISAIILAVLLVILLATLPLTDRVTAGAVGRLAATGALAGRLAAFWLVPVVTHRDLHGMLTSWENPHWPGGWPTSSAVSCCSGVR